MAEAGAGSLSAAIEQASSLLASDPAGAARRAQAILKIASADPRAALILASARRRLGDAVGARAVLEPLAKAYPGAALTAYELGLTLAALGETGPGITVLRRAVALKPDLADAWRALGDQLFLNGDAAGAEAAFAQHLRASVRDPALKRAADALFEGGLADAERLLRAHLSARPNDFVAMHMLAEAFTRQDRDGEAEILLAHALELDPGFDGARFNYATVLFRQQKGAEAMAQLEGLLAREPANPAFRNLLAGCLALIGEDARAIEVYEALLETYASQPRIWLNFGHVLDRGPAMDAAGAYKRAIELAPGLGDAYWSLANLKVAAFTAAEEAAMATQLRRRICPPTTGCICTSPSARRWRTAARRTPPSLTTRPARACAARIAVRRRGAHRLWRGRSTRLFTPAFFADRAGGGSTAQAPIFIVGLPRSGSTLIEQILASHSARWKAPWSCPTLGFRRDFGGGATSRLSGEPGRHRRTERR